MVKEEWKEFSDGRYKISNYGKILSTKKNILLRPSVVRGYEKVCIFIDGKYKIMSVHRLVAMNFIPNPNNYPQINHIDGNKENNFYKNLEWCTPSMNVKHAYKNGLNVYTDERRRKMSEVRARRKIWNPLKEETKKKISEARRGINNPYSKKILCVETGEIFNCLREAGERYNVIKQAIFHSIKKGTKSCGFHWKYKGE